MSKHTMVTLAKRGADEREMEAQDIVIPDLWHVAAVLEDAEGIEWSDYDVQRMARMVRTTWHFAHDLKRHIVEKEEPTPVEVLAGAGTVVLDPGDLRIAIEMLRTMYEVLHTDQPECCDQPADLVVETAGGQTRNITKHVPVVIEHLLGKLGE